MFASNTLREAVRQGLKSSKYLKSVLLLYSKISRRDRWNSHLVVIGTRFRRARIKQNAIRKLLIMGVTCNNALIALNAIGASLCITSDNANYLYSPYYSKQS